MQNAEWEKPFCILYFSFYIRISILFVPLLGDGREGFVAAGAGGEFGAELLDALDVGLEGGGGLAIEALEADDGDGEVAFDAGLDGAGDAFEVEEGGGCFGPH